MPQQDNYGVAPEASPSFQEIIFRLQQYWNAQGCAILQPLDMEVGAGTFHPATLLRALGPKPWRAAYVQPSRRPGDGRYGENPHRVGHYYQFQVIIKPVPYAAQDLYLGSLRAVGLDPLEHDVRFVEDDWENPTIGAAGLGWEIWCDGTEISQFTYFQQVGGLACEVPSLELTYGLERIACVAQGVSNFFALNWNGGEGDAKITYGDVFRENERQNSIYALEEAQTEPLFRHFYDYEAECQNLVEKGLPIPAYDQCMKASHTFNLLDARGVISVSERAAYIGRVRALAKAVCSLWTTQNDASATQ